MEIRKIDQGFEVLFESAKFFFDSLKIKKDSEHSYILTYKEKGENENKIFNLPGEYNVSDVYFWGFENKESLAFLFEEDNCSLVYFRKDIEENIKKQMKILKKEIDIIFSPDIENLDLVKELKSKMVVTSKDINLPKFNKEKGEKIKFNPKKVENLIFVLK